MLRPLLGIFTLALSACTSSPAPGAPDAGSDAPVDVVADAVCSGAPATCCKSGCDSCTDDALHRDAKPQLCVGGTWTCPVGMVLRTRTCTLEEICAARGGPRICCDACGRAVPTTCPPGSEFRACPAGAVGLYDDSPTCPAPEAGTCADAGGTDAATGDAADGAPGDGSTD